jgi:protein-tyrosine phosphatase
VKPLVGAITLTIEGRPVRITGGPFCSMPDGAFGLCLEVHDPRADQAALVVNVPDFGVPDEAELRAALDALLAAMRARPDRAYHIGCKAGLGRTGTAMACLARMAGIPGDSVAWVRTHYDPRAVETATQEDFVRAFLG